MPLEYMNEEARRRATGDKSAPCSSHFSTAADVVHAWMRGELDYPGDSYIICAMDEYMREHIRQQGRGMDVLASAELDNATRLIDALRSHFGLCNKSASACELCDGLGGYAITGSTGPGQLCPRCKGSGVQPGQ